MNCPKCNHIEKSKDGIVRGLQRYKCKACHFRYTVSRKSDVKPIQTKRLALQLYLEGLGFRAIGRILQISYGTVYQWVKGWGSQVSLPTSQQAVEIVEIDELHTYIGSKKSTVGYGLLLIDLANGSSLICVEIDQLAQD